MAAGRVVGARLVVVLGRAADTVDAIPVAAPDTTQTDATPPMTPATNPGTMLRTSERLNICDPFTLCKMRLSIGQPNIANNAHYARAPVGVQSRRMQARVNISLGSLHLLAVASSRGPRLTPPGTPRVQAAVDEN
jgi:hypothetical protein